jgi:hypothetical protein
MKSVAFHFDQKQDGGAKCRYPAFEVALEM